MAVGLDHIWHRRLAAVVLGYGPRTRLLGGDRQRGLDRQCPGAGDTVQPHERGYGRSIPSASRVKSARASGTYEDQGPSLAIDGTMRQWSSGGFPPQWLEVELKGVVEISEVRLTVGQSPDGPTVHQLWIKPPDKDYAMVHEFKGNTKDLQVLEFRPTGVLPGSAVKIVTTASPSWVGWREIEVFGKYRE